MVIETLAALSLLALQPPALPDQLVISIVVTDRKNKPIADLTAAEVTVNEGGARRAVTRLERDQRPLKIAVVLDTSANMGDTLQADAVPAVLSFLGRVPPGTPFAVWITTDRPKLLVPEGTDLEAAREKLRSTAALGNNAAVETLVAASKEIARTEGTRSAVVLVTTATMGEVRADAQVLLPQASLKPTYIAVELVGSGGQGDPRLEDSIRVLVNRTAGFHERIYSSMAIETQLRRAADLFGGQYRLAWKPAADPRRVKIEVKVGRKDTRVIQAQRLSTAW
jgi:hypothetical protein